MVMLRNMRQLHVHCKLSSYTESHLLFRQISTFLLLFFPLYSCDLTVWIMAEGTLHSYDPLAYYVNNIADLNPQVVKAHNNKDKQLQEELLSGDKSAFDIFICVNKHGHAFVLCVPNQDENSPFSDMMSADDVFQIPEVLLCWSYELCFENAYLRMYKIRKGYDLFKDLKQRIDRAYYVVTFKGIPKNGNAFQFAALRAAPHRYNAILSDCVEFSKEFCISLLSYCSNWKEIEEVVNKRIKEASATGLSLERLSRKYRASGFFGNLSLGGTDVTSLLTQQRGGLLCLLLVYPVIVAVIVAVVMKYYF